MRTNKEQWFKLLEEGNLTKITDFLKKHPKSVHLVEDSESKQTCVFYAVQHEDQGIGDRLLKIFLHKGAKADKRDNIDQTSLFYAARFAHIKQIDLLAKFGCDPNIKDTYGQSALYYAAREGQVLSINRLIHHGASVNSTDNLNQTALFYACREGRCEAAKALVKAGADVNIADKSRNTPLSWARRSHDLGLIDFLLSLGASDRPPKRKREERREERRRTEKKVKCYLMLVDTNGEKRPATLQELESFEKSHPEISKYWKDPSTQEELESMDLESLDSIRLWEKPAKKLINTLWKAPHAWIFHEPVDPQKLGIPDYFEVIKKPMDFSTIRVRDI